MTDPDMHNALCIVLKLDFQALGEDPAATEPGTIALPTTTFEIALHALADLAEVAICDNDLELGSSVLRHTRELLKLNPREARPLLNQLKAVP
jgi:hypothetical protein